MSNRPVRLKYLKPKMKIILCIFLLYITVSVFGQSVELNRILGESVKFPAAVEKGGSLMYSRVTIGDVTSGSFRTPRNERFNGRVQWDSRTGLFSLSGLKMEDIGEYKVQNTDQNINTVFQLNVYKDNVPVSKPHVSITQNEYPCTIECTAERGTEVTLSWYREGQTKPYSRSSVRSAPHLDLPQTVERSGTYTCEAKNSVSNEKASITVGDHCTAPTNPFMWILIGFVVLLLLLAIVAYCLRRRILRFKRRRRAVRTLIQVKKLIDNVDLHGYDEPDPPDAVRTLIQVKKKFDNLDPRACGVETVIQVKMLLANVDVQEYVKMLFDNVDLYKNDETVHPDAVRTLIQVKVLLNDLDLREYGMFTYHPEATEKTTSSHETEVPLKQVTCEVGDT